MRWTAIWIGLVCGAGPAVAQDLDARCALSCVAGARTGFDEAACLALLCRGPLPGVPEQAGPAWQAGRMDDPHHGGFASVRSADDARELLLTCESSGPIVLVLRSGSAQAGEVQVVVPGFAPEWLVLRQRDGALRGELPRGTGLVQALRLGSEVSLIAQSGHVTGPFPLRGAARAIDRAMGYCMER